MFSRRLKAIIYCRRLSFIISLSRAVIVFTKSLASLSCWFYQNCKTHKISYSYTMSTEIEAYTCLFLWKWDYCTSHWHPLAGLLSMFPSCCLFWSYHSAAQLRRMPTKNSNQYDWYIQGIFLSQMFYMLTVILGLVSCEEPCLPYRIVESSVSIEGLSFLFFSSACIFRLLS